MDTSVVPTPRLYKVSMLTGSKKVLCLDVLSQHVLQTEFHGTRATNVYVIEV
jgi:hypothetical protein